MYEYDKVVLEVDQNNEQTGRNIYGINLLARKACREILYYFYNGHADVTALVDATGNIVSTFYYDAFGNTLEETGGTIAALKRITEGTQEPETNGLNFKTAIDLGSTRQVGVNTYKTKVEYYLDPAEFKELQIPIEDSEIPFELSIENGTIKNVEVINYEEEKHNIECSLDNNKVTGKAVFGGDSSINMNANDYFLFHRGYLYGGYNFEIYSRFNTEKTIRETTAGKIDVRLALDNDTYTINTVDENGTPAQITDSNQNRDVTLFIYSNVYNNVVENKDLCVDLKVQNDSDNRLTIQFDQRGNRVKLMDRDGNNILLKSDTENILVYREPQEIEKVELEVTWEGQIDATELTSRIALQENSQELYNEENTQDNTDKAKLIEAEIQNAYRYAGYQYDEETDLYYLNARMYDPKIARFLQEDTYRGEANDPLSLNLYTYCNNNPLIYYDPTGHRPEWLDRSIDWIEDKVSDFKQGIETLSSWEKSYKALEMIAEYASEEEQTKAVIAGGVGRAGIIIKDSIIGATISMFEGTYRTAQVVFTAGAATLINTTEAEDLWKTFDNSFQNFEKDIAKYVALDEEAYANSRVTGYAADMALGVGTLFEGAISLSQTVKNIKSVGNTSNFGIDPYTRIGFSVPDDFTKVNIPVLPKNNVQKNVIKAIDNVDNANILSKGTGKAGSLVIEQGGKYSASEINAANYMKGLGNDVTLRPPTGTRAGGGTSDLIVNGVNYDVYTPITNNPDRIISAIAAKKDQAAGIVLDLSQTNVTATQLGDIMARLKGKGVTTITDVVIMK